MNQRREGRSSGGAATQRQTWVVDTTYSGLFKGRKGPGIWEELGAGDWKKLNIRWKMSRKQEMEAGGGGEGEKGDLPF